MEILPSLISSNILNLEKTIIDFDGHCDGFHIDVMDDHFVPNLTWGPMFVNAIGAITGLPLHIHLMVENPSNWVNRLTLRSNDCFIFHAEIFDLPELVINFIERIKSNLKCKVGVAVNPRTEIASIFKYIKYLDHVLIMSVEPGFSGQKFIESVVNKIEPLKNKRTDHGLFFTIAMDGGIGPDNIVKLNKLGVDQFGIASAIFSKSDPLQALSELYKI
ncbi:ribulose-phosphate 3-epimerase [Candidatus Dependentiae bacterium]|nr:ribulose-phosphate 3-epimerase [Candidatus Dependentiae bacterium]